jgi:hypothetical protein
MNIKAAVAAKEILRSRKLGRWWESGTFEIWGRMLDKNVGGAKGNYCREEESVIKKRTDNSKNKNKKGMLERNAAAKNWNSHFYRKASQLQ